MLRRRNVRRVCGWGEGCADRLQVGALRHRGRGADCLRGLGLCRLSGRRVRIQAHGGHPEEDTREGRDYENRRATQRSLRERPDPDANAQAVDSLVTSGHLPVVRGRSPPAILALSALLKGCCSTLFPSSGVPRREGSRVASPDPQVAGDNPCRWQESTPFSAARKNRYPSKAHADKDSGLRAGTVPSFLRKLFLS